MTITAIGGPTTALDGWLYVSRGIVPGNVMALEETMSDWQPIETAPKDGTAIQARIPGHGSDNVIAWGEGLMTTDGEDCGGWYFASEQEPPDDWTDGTCWEVNADGVPSTEPTEWKPLPASTKEEQQ